MAVVRVVDMVDSIGVIDTSSVQNDNKIFALGQPEGRLEQYAISIL